MAYSFMDQMYDSIAKIIKPKVSVLSDLIAKKNNDRLKIIDRVKIPQSCLKDMRMEINNALKMGYIDEDLEYIYINAKGIYAVENERGRFSTEDFIDFINKKYFDLLVKKHKPLNDRRKLILFFLISIRAYSSESSLKLSRGNEILDTIKEYLKVCSTLLIEIEVINKGNFIAEMEEKGNETEHLVSNLMRHAEDIQMATEQIFKCPGNNQYYVDISEEGKVDLQKMAFLFHKIANKKLSCEEIEKISAFCNRMSRESMFTVYADIDNHIFKELKYNNAVKEALEEHNIVYYG